MHARAHAHAREHPSTRTRTPGRGSKTPASTPGDGPFQAFHAYPGSPKSTSHRPLARNERPVAITGALP
eukprot:4858834-Alexandrium_andersonii.AAC.1